MLAEFYEMQTQFVTIRYQMNLNSETSNILTLLGATLHLEIFRMREKNLDFNISLKNFLKINEYIRTNVNSFNHGHNIISIVKEFETEYGNAKSIGIGMPGIVSNDTSLVKRKFFATC